MCIQSIKNEFVNAIKFKKLIFANVKNKLTHNIENLEYLHAFAIINFANIHRSILIFLVNLYLLT